MQLVKRSLSVVSTLSHAPNGLTFQQLCDQLDMPGASMHRLLSVLCNERFISRSEVNRRYFLGPAAWDVARRIESGSPLLAAQAANTLKLLSSAVHKTVLLTELIDGYAICTARTDHDETPCSTAPGSILPLHATAAARTLLVDREDFEVRRLLTLTDFTLYTERTPRGVHDVLRHIYLTRRYGHDISRGEHEEGVWELSAPVRGGAGQVLGSVTVTTHVDHTTRPGVRDRIRERVLEAAEEIGAELGHSAAGHAHRAHD